MSLVLVMVTSMSSCSGGWDPERAEALWTQHCARCHGPDGRGERRLAVLSPRLDLLASEMVQRGPVAGRSIRRAITEGYGTMPGFEYRLEPEEIDLLTAWVAALPKRSENHVAGPPGREE